jgi:hypothetical protein
MAVTLPLRETVGRTQVRRRGAVVVAASVAFIVCPFIDIGLPSSV